MQAAGDGVGRLPQGDQVVRLQQRQSLGGLSRPPAIALERMEKNEGGIRGRKRSKFQGQRYKVKGPRFKLQRLPLVIGQ